MSRSGVHVDFAWRTFIWSSEPITKVQVHCVIVGQLSCPGHPEMKNGSKPTDGAWYLFDDEQKREFIESEPESEQEAASGDEEAKRE